MNIALAEATAAAAQASATEDLLSAVILVVLWIGIMSIFGTTTRRMSRSKGYEGGFAWGFFLGVIGIIVVAVRPDRLNFKHDSSSIDNLVKLADLHEKGIITDTEYAQKKEELLKRI